MRICIIIAWVFLIILCIGSLIYLTITIKKLPDIQGLKFTLNRKNGKTIMSWNKIESPDNIVYSIILYINGIVYNKMVKKSSIEFNINGTKSFQYYIIATRGGYMNSNPKEGFAHL